ITHYEMFSTLIGLKGAYEIAFKEIIQLYYNSKFEILKESHESSRVKLHDSEELLKDLKDKGLIKKKFEEYFQY
ncbi:MAG: hypothetical protein ACFFKA_19440, partial [Candidatus Thorarchaeota archaeon]